MYIEEGCRHIHKTAVGVPSHFLSSNHYCSWGSIKICTVQSGEFSGRLSLSLNVPGLPYHSNWIKYVCAFLQNALSWLPNHDPFLIRVGFALPKVPSTIVLPMRLIHFPHILIFIFISIYVSMWFIQLALIKSFLYILPVFSICYSSFRSTAFSLDNVRELISVS